MSINIPGFIKNIERREFKDAAAVLKETSALPAVCGRVCPQERQCESKCIYNKMKKQPVAIGYLERFAADTENMRDHSQDEVEMPVMNGKKVAVAGSALRGYRLPEQWRVLAMMLQSMRLFMR